jgi:hypothetical protein
MLATQNYKMTRLMQHARRDSDTAALLLQNNEYSTLIDKKKCVFFQKEGKSENYHFTMYGYCSQMDRKQKQRLI